MKRWTSISFALGTFIGTLVIGVFALLQLHVLPSSAAASPVYTTTAQTVSSASDTALTSAQASLAAKGIALSLAPPYVVPNASWDTYTTSNDPNVTQAASEIQQEWGKYSADTVQKSGLKAIYLIKDLVVDGQARSGFPEPRFGDALYFDISSHYLQSENTMYLRRTFHHEFRHLIDYNLSGSFTSADTVWTSCNASDFRYGNGGPSMYADPAYAHKEHPFYAFVDGYATSGIDEDKAEVFARYMTDPNSLQSLANKDAGVTCKVAQTQKLLQSL